MIRIKRRKPYVPVCIYKESPSTPGPDRSFHEDADISPASILWKQVVDSEGDWKISFSFSPDSLKAPVFYRAVPLPFSWAVDNKTRLKWYLGDVTGAVSLEAERRIKPDIFGRTSDH